MPIRADAGAATAAPSADAAATAADAAGTSKPDTWTTHARTTRARTTRAASTWSRSGPERFRRGRRSAALLHASGDLHRDRELR